MNWLMPQHPELLEGPRHGAGHEYEHAGGGGSMRMFEQSSPRSLFDSPSAPVTAKLDGAAQITVDLRVDASPEFLTLANITANSNTTAGGNLGTSMPDSSTSQGGRN